MELPEVPTKTDLDKILLKACDDQFHKAFGFQYKIGDSKPDDKVPDSTIYACKTQFTAEQLTETSVAEFVDKIMKCVSFYHIRYSKVI